jgi:hypothetical protein
MASLKQRGDVFYIQYYVGTVQKRISTGTNSYQLAKEKLRQLESAQLRGDDNPLPTRTPIADVVTAYVNHIRTVALLVTTIVGCYPRLRQVRLCVRRRIAAVIRPGRAGRGTLNTLGRGRGCIPFPARVLAPSEIRGRNVPFSPRAFRLFTRIRAIPRQRLEQGVLAINSVPPASWSQSPDEFATLDSDGPSGRPATGVVSR